MANGAVNPQVAIDAAAAAQALLDAAAAQAVLDAAAAQAVLDAAAAQAVLDAAAAQAILDAAAAQAAQAAGVNALPLVVRTWDTLVAEAKIEPHTIAHQLIQETQAVPWEEAMSPFTRFLVITKDNAYQPEAGQWLYADDMAKNYYLTVMDNKWEVVFGYRRCTPLHANGHRLAGLRGDRLLIRGTVTTPGMYQLQGGMNNQSDLFTKNSAPACTTAEIVVAAAADPAMNWKDPDVGPAVHGWPMLPIHPKIAILFLHGRSLMEGFHLGVEILAMFPAERVEERELWEGQLRVGVTRTAAGVDTSVLTRGWTRADPYSSPALTDWYFALLAAAGPVAAPSTPGLHHAPSSGTPGLHHAPSSGTPGLVHAPSAVTDATLELLLQMTDRMASTSVSTGRSTARSYDWVEHEYLLERVGVARVLHGTRR
jgi:hypothetical protein